MGFASINIKELPCIRCDECARVCPVNLQPLQLHWYSQEFNVERLTDYSLFACVECGDCDSVCPSHIPLTNEFIEAKNKIRNKQQKQHQAEENKKRYLNKLARNKKQEEEKVKIREERIIQDKDDALKKKQDAIAAAVKRVKEKRQQKS